MEDTTEIDLVEVGCEVVELIHLAQDRDDWWAHGKAVMNFRIP
jgi:hypothetical protein